MRVFGIDPGSEKLGFGVVDLVGSDTRLVDQGVIRASRRLPFHQRLLVMHEGLTETLGRHSPQVVAVEQVFFGRNVKTALKIGECRGVAMLAAVQAGATLVEYAARDVKKAVVGTGAAQKEQVQWMIARTFGIANDDLAEDAADALAICVTHAQRRRFDALTG